MTGESPGDVDENMAGEFPGDVDVIMTGESLGDVDVNTTGESPGRHFRLCLSGIIIVKIYINIEIINNMFWYMHFVNLKH